MIDTLTYPLTTLIATTLGLRLNEQEQAMLWQKILLRLESLGFSSPEAYYHALLSSSKSAIAAAEWQAIVRMVTIPESYFFRDQGQFSLLQNHVFPELLKRKQSLDARERKTLRVWSAGCSTGEEAYSLAILIHELIPDIQTWNIVILGTDVNQTALEQAKSGVYPEWSFRSINPVIRQKYFHQQQRNWQIDSTIRSMVTFQTGNLVQDNYPSLKSGIHDFDLILCRNVFIYFDSESIARVLKKFCKSLVPNGYLITGHTELHGQDTNQFQVKTFSESMLYQRDVNLTLVHSNSVRPSSSVGTEKPRYSIPASSLSKKSLYTTDDRSSSVHPSSTIETLCNEINALMDRKAYVYAIHKAKQLITQSPQHFQGHYLIAQIYANLGDHAQAMQACHQALQLDPLAVSPLYLLAHIAVEQGDIQAAKKLLKRIIYLVPTAVYAYFELGNLYQQEGNSRKAQTIWQSTLDLLKQLPPTTAVEGYRNLTAAELQNCVERNLQA
jgi:chemotaxis protein methyltransferase CheR